MTLADEYYERNPDGTYASSQDAFEAIRCVDDPRITDPAQSLARAQAYNEAAPFLDSGRGVSSARDSCAFWPVPPTSQPHLPQVPDLSAPPLVVSTTGDPATPYQAGRRAGPGAERLAADEDRRRAHRGVPELAVRRRHRHALPDRRHAAAAGRDVPGHVSGVTRPFPGSGPRLGSAHGSPAGVRPAHAGRARHPLRAAVVHRRARLPQVGGRRARGARGRVRRGHRLRRVGDRGLRPGLRVRHGREARPVDVPGAALGDRGRRALLGADVLRHHDARRLAVLGRPAPRPAPRARRRPPRPGSPATCTPRSSSTCCATCPATARRRCPPTPAATSTRPATTPRRTSGAGASSRSRRWASRWSSATTRAAPASRRSTCATPTP